MSEHFLIEPCRRSHHECHHGNSPPINQPYQQMYQRPKDGTHEAPYGPLSRSEAWSFVLQTLGLTKPPPPPPTIWYHHDRDSPPNSQHIYHPSSSCHCYQLNYESDKNVRGQLFVWIPTQVGLFCPRTCLKHQKDIRYLTVSHSSSDRLCILCLHLTPTSLHLYNGTSGIKSKI